MSTDIEELTRTEHGEPKLACHFLLKSAIIARRKTFEYLAFHIFGSLGKLAIEIGMIGFLLGTCIAFFVVMGDLGPEIIAKMTGIYTTNTMRTSILMALALFLCFTAGLVKKRRQFKWSIESDNMFLLLLSFEDRFRSYTTYI
ncbi:hypothetical protein NQ317_000012 [Molorchus minor]|uniref:Amino acid transporter transmembrane domain-containing protein n=1 Tax=Molorchus minor TaxID=1323400 RepID=A0ABQ9JC89_9CUCU|nr:hypothetical protein NQ317_000012 [Molorchus minor]